MNSTAEIGYAECGYAAGKIRQVLRGEALAILAASTTLFFLFGGDLWMFAVLFFAPDISIAGYAAGPKAGAAIYNAVHSYALHAVLAVAGVLTGSELLWQISLIFIAHAAFDRSLGYGLKYAAGFRHTHLGPIGKPTPRGD
ncbi:MAG: DUF4260 domain-containing protein [Aliihoeflea sp.]|uniref:DUF4260 domain-containing protein n=1 Tax=Aliihoeflea sp. TaxID=2608088 RepID=UPI0040377338